MGFWDDNELAVGGDYISLGQPGDTISGTITNMRKREFPGKDGKPPQVVPELFIQTDAGTVIGGVQVAPGDHTFTAGAFEIKKELNTWRPEIGDHLTVVRGQLEQIKGGKFIGHYQVTVQRRQQQAPQNQPQAPVQYQQPVQQPVQYAPPQQAPAQPGQFEPPF